MTFLQRWKARLLLVLAVVGPGFITANVDNDAGGIYTYSLAGAQFGYALLWTMIPITIALVVVQEMAARMGAVTGKGLSDLIREEFGFRVTFLLMVALVITNFGNVVAEFAGVASSLELFGISRYIIVPLAAALVWLLVVRGHLRQHGEDLPGGVGVLRRYIVAGLLAHPDWKAAAVVDGRAAAGVGIRNYGYLFMVIGLVGTTIAPWMQFYLQASIVEKGHHGAAVPGVALGRDPRLPVHRRRRLVHHRRVRGDAVRARPARDRGRRRRGAGAAAAGRRVRLSALCRRPVQRVALRGVHPADLDRLRRLRRHRPRVGSRQALRRGAGLLLALHAC